MTFRPALLVALTAAIALSACSSGRPDKRHGPPPGDPGMMQGERMQHLVARYTERWDSNNDGIASCDDLGLSRSRLFRMLDEDNDGLLSTGEYRHAKFEGKSFMFFDFMAVDKDHSAAISVEELVAVPNSQFLAADKDHDCRISPEEAMAAMREMRMGGERPEGGRRGKGGRGGPDGPPPQNR